MATFHPTLKSLKQKLRVQPINTGRSFTNNGQANGIVFDDIERLHALVGVDGCLHLKSGTEFSMIQYRGQNEDFGVCKTTIDRYISLEEQFLSICRTIAFEELLEDHPFIKLTNPLQINGNPLCLNLTGIAQHYELATNYLDITNNFDVACFFATCKYENGKYYPIGNISKPGVIYKIYEMVLPPFVQNENNKEILLEYLGWQPLPRPEQQRASVLKVAKGTNLDTVSGIQKYYFKHSISQSKKIWNQFDKGEALFPHDSAADLANECKKLNYFTNKQIDKALERLELWSCKKLENKEQTLDNMNIKIVDNNSLSWDNLIDISSEYWEGKFDETMDKVGFRMSAYS
ncbi:hypothetical protein M947_08800 [Sulfurimonas hongkongensis]|uniref:FRG domain-containing protein n=1 Tax=Sulfurimonas hongkongensis TaxID=1172190 RepID=T0JBC3_9BACT|nr:FRG domain-containing protein [Sulfurimonas hongkongensis]EQB35371.1 hypothetical protein M947_08800 [Sulfurimonas hongkongensis]